MMKISCNMQSGRITEHPIQIDNSNLIIFDNLESGILRIYEYVNNGSLIVQKLKSRYVNCKNAVLLAEAYINDLWKDNGIFIHKISCEYGHEYLIQPIIYQILHFAYFYQYQIIGISEREYRNCYPYAKEILSDFKMVNLIYEYSL